jgi:hypothetical protein
MVTKERGSDSRKTPTGGHSFSLREYLTEEFERDGYTFVRIHGDSRIWTPRKDEGELYLFHSQAEEVEDVLDEKEKLLITLKEELYFGQWGKMLQDLYDRKRGRPYIFKLVDRIDEDIRRIYELMGIEYTLDGEFMLGEFNSDITISGFMGIKDKLQAQLRGIKK